jgi:5-methylcytosine-specific restriction endonuclease McrA
MLKTGLVILEEGFQGYYGHRILTRKKISKKTRFQVLNRDGFTCQYCGRRPPVVKLHVDHVVPVSKGGKNHISNLVTSCQDCNLGKSNRYLQPRFVNSLDGAGVVKNMLIRMILREL